MIPRDLLVILFEYCLARSWLRRFIVPIEMYKRRKAREKKCINQVKQFSGVARCAIHSEGYAGNTEWCQSRPSDSP